MNKFLLLLAFLFGAASSSAQYNSESKEVTVEDLKTNSFPSDTTANAFYIFEDGYSRFQDGGDYNLLTDYTAKIKILNDKGYEQATIEIPLSKGESGKELIRDLKANTYNLKNGKIFSRRLNPSKVYTEEHEDYDLVKFTFPDVNPGSVLAYSYQKESPFRFNFETWWFQDEIPKLYSRFKTKIPGNYNYSISKVSDLPLQKKDSKIVKNCFLTNVATEAASCVSTEYVMTDIPAFIEEDYLTSRYNYLARIEFELKTWTRLDGYVKRFTRSWEDVEKELRTDRSIGRQLKKTSLVEDILPDSIKNQQNDLTKAKAIFNFVKKNYHWNGEYDIFNDMSLKDVIEEHAGNVSGINILLHNIYEEQGFDVLPVLSATRNRGVPTKLFPVLSDFNYLLLQLKLGEDTYLVDATEKYAPFGTIPFRSLNFYGRLLDFENGSSWVDLEPKSYSGVAFDEEIKLQADGTASGTSHQVLSGYSAIDARDKLNEADAGKPITYLANSNEQTKAISSISGKKDGDEDLKLTYLLNNKFQKVGDRIYVNPFSFRFFEENPFKLEHRTYPIDFGHKDIFVYSIKIELPEGMTVEEFPEQQLIALPENAGKIQFMTTQLDEKTVSVQCRMMLSRALYAPGFYPYLKKFFNSIMDIQKQSRLVIRENS